MKHKLKFGPDIIEVDVDFNGDLLKIQLNEELTELQTRKGENSSLLLNDDGHNVKAHAVRVKDQIYLHILGRHWVVEDVTAQDDSSYGAGGTKADNILSPMPGSVIKVLVEEGQEVKHGQPLVIVEAMKMENQVTAPSDTVIGKILVQAGQQVGAGEVLIVFAEPDKDEEAPTS